MSTRKTGWRLRSGTWPAGSVDASYEIERLPFASDQNFSYPWTLNSSKMQQVSLPRVVVNMDLSQRGDGPVQTSLWFSYMTFGMLKNFMGSFLPNLSFTSGTQTAAVTFMGYDNFDDAVFIQGSIQVPKVPLKWAVGGWTDVEFPINTGIIISP